jgi:hypothetical protein
MKNFKSVTEWLKTNPSQDEQTKVLNLINRGASHQVRKEVWQKESYLRKLQGMVRYFDKLEMKKKINIIEKYLHSIK